MFRRHDDSLYYCDRCRPLLPVVDNNAEMTNRNVWANDEMRTQGDDLTPSQQFLYIGLTVDRVLANRQKHWNIGTPVHVNIHCHCKYYRSFDIYSRKDKVAQ